MRFSFILILIALISCKSQEKVVKTDPSKQEEISFKVIKTGTNSGYNELTNIQVYAQRGLEIVWDTLTMNFIGEKSLPIVDWKTKQLFLATMGEKRTGGYTIKITSVFETKKNIIINLEESKPGKTCMTTSALTYPYQLIELKRFPVKKKVIYVRNDRIYECEK